MFNWVLSIGSVVILTSVIMMILPSGKTSVIIKSIFSLIVLLVVISPITKINNANIGVQNIFSGGKIDVQDDFLQFIGESKIKAYNQNCQKILNDFGIKDTKLDFEYIITDDYKVDVQKVKVDLKNSVINSDKAHIDIIEEVKIAFSEYLNIDVGRIDVYE